MMEATRRHVERDHKPLVDTSYQQPFVPSKTPALKTACDYKDDLLLAISPLIAILLAFGGRLSVLVACFGGLICYIFDLQGSVEVSGFYHH